MVEKSGRRQFKEEDRILNPGTLALQAAALATRPWLLRLVIVFVSVGVNVTISKVIEDNFSSRRRSDSLANG